MKNNKFDFNKYFMNKSFMNKGFLNANNSASKNPRNQGLLIGVLIGAVLYVLTESYAVVVFAMFLGMMIGVGLDRRSKRKDESESGKEQKKIDSKTSAK